jgi:hypothetical protein
MTGAQSRLPFLEPRGCRRTWPGVALRRRGPDTIEHSHCSTPNGVWAYALRLPEQRSSGQRSLMRWGPEPSLLALSPACRCIEKRRLGRGLPARHPVPTEPRGSASYALLSQACCLEPWVPGASGEAPTQVKRARCSTSLTPRSSRGRYLPVSCFNRPCKQSRKPNLGEERESLHVPGKVRPAGL